MRQIRRPLQNRQSTGRMFGEDAYLVRVEQTRNKYGHTIKSQERFKVRVATTPLSPSDPRAALLMSEGGTRIEDAREFFTDFNVDVGKRDKIIYPAIGGDTYTIISAAAYPSHHCLIGQRDEKQ